MTTSNLDKRAGLSKFSHIKDTLTMLSITIAQIRTSLSDSNANVDTLSSSFAQIADHVLTIHESAVAISCIEPKDQMELDLIQASSAQAKAKINNAVVDFQFFDLLDQRLGHVIKSLDDMSTLIQNPDRLQDPRAWMELQSNLHDSYSTESERLMFASIVGGSSIEEAIAIYHANCSKNRHKDNADDVEIF